MQDFPAHDIDDISLRDPYKSRTIALLNNNYRELFKFLPSSDAALDPAFLSHKPTLSNNENSIFSRRFSIFVEAEDGSFFHAQHVDNNELLSFYSINHTSISLDLDGSTLDDFLSFRFPWNLRKSVFDLALKCSVISDTLAFSTSVFVILIDPEPLHC